MKKNVLIITGFLAVIFVISVITAAVPENVIDDEIQANTTDALSVGDIM